MPGSKYLVVSELKGRENILDEWTGHVLSADIDRVAISQ